ncbi:MAG: 3-deoxy-manno-octulosonate cytidylyltransferase [Bacteroidota bacterium]
MKSLAIIPARFASTRFPGKPLADIEGKPMIQHVYERTEQATLVDSVIVATDDERIAQAVRQFGGKVEMTATTHQSGTDRCAEVAQRHTAFDCIVNVQGDEPFIQPEQIDQVLRPFTHVGTTTCISTLAKKIEERAQLLRPSVVKVVFDTHYNALYFSRNAIPYLRDVAVGNWLQQADFYKHIGIYAFRRDILQEVANLAPTRLERLEKLEQLRWLAHGYPITVTLTQWESRGIDTPGDLEQLSQ